MFIWARVFQLHKIVDYGGSCYFAIDSNDSASCADEKMLQCDE
jgi:hypothetical protein